MFWKILNPKKCVLERPQTITAITIKALSPLLFPQAFRPENGPEQITVVILTLHDYIVSCVCGCYSVQNPVAPS